MPAMDVSPPQAGVRRTRLRARARALVRVWFYERVWSGSAFSERRVFALVGRTNGLSAPSLVREPLGPLAPY